MASRTAALKQTKTITWPEYQAAVLADANVPPRAKLLAARLFAYADYKTTPGANCLPPTDDLAKELGWSDRAVRRCLGWLRSHGIIKTIPLRTRAGRWNRNGYQFLGHGFVGPVLFDNLDWLRPSGSPRRADRARDRATGRFVEHPSGHEVAIGSGHEVAIGDEPSGHEVANQTLQLTTDPAVDLAASATAPEQETCADVTPTPDATPTPDRKPSGDNTPVGTYSELDRKASDKDDEFDRWRRQLDTQLGENAVTEPVIPNGGG